MTTNADLWQPLRTELEAWQAQGRAATLWWRDDDAHDVTAALERMLLLSDAYAVPLGLAVIPAKATPALADRVARAGHCSVLQHGYSHANHAPAGVKKAEFGAHRPLSDLLADASAGWAILNDWPGFVPNFVPPWNRWTPDLAPGLEAIGIRTISTFGSRLSATVPPSRIGQINTHIDVIDWRGSRGFAGTSSVLRHLTEHLIAKRHGIVDADEPTGLLTHHLDHDDSCWQFIEHLFDVCAASNTVRWVAPKTLVETGAIQGRTV